MTQSPWARNEADTIAQTAKPSTNKTGLTRQDEDRLAQIQELQRLMVWGNSQVSAYLYCVMDDFPHVDVHKPLFASYSFRTIHDLILNTTTEITKRGHATPADFDLMVHIVSNDAPNDNDVQSRTQCAGKIEKAFTDYQNSRAWPCPEHEAVLATSIYAALAHYAADTMQPLPNQNGYIHHRMVQMLADKADTAVSDMKTGQNAEAALEPRELADHDNIIQSGYQLLNDYLARSLERLRYNAERIDPRACEDFGKTVGDVNCAGSYLEVLHDSITELYAAHEWPIVYEHLAYHNMCTTDPKKGEQLPPLDAAAGIHAYLDDFIHKNRDTEIHPQDAPIVWALIEGIRRDNPLYGQALHRG